MTAHQEHDPQTTHMNSGIQKRDEQTYAVVCDGEVIFELKALQRVTVNEDAHLSINSRSLLSVANYS